MIARGGFYMRWGNYSWVNGWNGVRSRSSWLGSLSLFQNRTGYKRSSSS